MKSYIADGLLALMARSNYSSITVNQIVEKAGVHRSTYYRHFESKEDVIRYYFQRIIAEYVQSCTNVDLTYPQFLIGFFNHLLQYKTQLLVIHRNHLSHLLQDVYRHLLSSNVAKNKTTAEQYRTAFQIGGSASLLIFWFSRGMVDSAEQMTQYVLKILPADYDSYLMPKNKS